MFFDQAKIHVAAGTGGNGCISFRREKHVPRGGPDGGDGGRGGDIFIVVDPQVRDLQQFTFKAHFKAGSGGAGTGAKKHGARGESVRIAVPIGTQVWVEQESEPRLFADMVHRDQELLVAHGGGGGRGNARFTTSMHQVPRFAELGEEGESLWVDLSLKLMADAGLAGLPNAGKSSLLRRVSNAKPKVAAYPFTTLEPMLGVVDWSGEGDVFTLADVPGLLEGASEGVGLGHEFLAHLERCLLLVHVVDVLGSSGAEPIEGFRTILRELDAHAGGLAAKPQVVVLNKTDSAEPDVVEKQRDTFIAEVERLRGQGHTAFDYKVGEGTPAADRLVWPVSAVSGSGIGELLRWIGPVLVELGGLGEKGMEEAALPSIGGSSTVSDRGGHVLYQPKGLSGRSFVVRRSRKGFEVRGESVRRLVRRFDLENEEAVRYLAERFERLGVYAALRAEGAQPGDDVDIEGFAFVFE
jgi:GTP-binding protein